MAEYIEREATIKLLRSLGSRDYRREKVTIQHKNYGGDLYE